MRLATLDIGGQGRLGAQLPTGDFIDLARAAQAQTLEVWLPDTLITLLEAGPAGMGVVTGIVDRVQSATGGRWEQHVQDRIILPPNTRVLAPVPKPGLILAAGLAYRAHAAEMANVPPVPHPTVFTKAPGSVVGHEATIPLPTDSPGMVDYEGELACVIGRRCHRASPSQALACIAGYTAANDVSARDWLGKVMGAQTPWEGRWTWEQNLLGKQFPGFTPLGPVMTTADEVGDPVTLSLSTRLNGEEMQNTSISDLIFSVGETVSYYSQWYELGPGDVVLTGTPNGVGVGRKPPVFMKSGDVVEVEVSGVGILRNTVAAARI